MTENLLIRETGSVYEVLFNRPEKYNAISNEMIENLRIAIDTFASRGDLRVMRLGATGKYFTAGVEISPEISPNVGDSTLDGRHWYRKKFHMLFDEFEAIEKPIVATHQGNCLGGGLELSLSCDFRLAAESVHYGLPEINIGALPGSGGISRLTRIAGPHWTRWLVMAGEQVSAQQAVSMGFVHAVYSDESFEEQAMAFCQKLAKQPREVLGLAKLSIELATDLGRSQARDIERISNSILFTGSEHKELVQAFIEKQAEKHTRKTKGEK
jgi:enoyl-CoA hydratase